MYLLQFDGGSRGNPGLAAIGYVIYDNENNDNENNDINNNNDIIAECSSIISTNATNNYAEYMGLLYGLMNAKCLNIKSLRIEGDSQLIIKQMKGEYNVKSKNIVYLYQQCYSIAKEFEEITFTHIYRDNNKYADSLVNIAFDRYINKKDKISV